MSASSSSSVSRAEIERFAAQAGEWWNPRGAFRFLHELGPLRLSYVKAQLGRSLKGLRVLDIGCGGGLMAEALAREGAVVTGLDACEESISAARAHAAQSGLSIAYVCASAEEIEKQGAVFDLIVALEIIEHVVEPVLFMKALGAMLRPGGKAVFATVNRTKKSFLFGVLAAEYLLGWVAPGTHDWERFIRPGELAALCEKEGLSVTDCSGVVFRPLAGCFDIEKGRTDVNYFLTAQKG